VEKDHWTYARGWENVEGSLGEVRAPWKVVNEEMKGEVQVMGRGKVHHDRCANAMLSRLGLTIVDRVVA
jgi:hypothetical protein